MPNVTTVPLRRVSPFGRTVARLLLSVALLSAAALPSACHTLSNETIQATDENLARLNAALYRKPKDATLRYERGRVLMDLQRLNEAIADLQAATELDPDNIDYLLSLSDAFFANGNVEKSYETLQRALDLNPEHFEALLKMSEITFYSKDFDRSMAMLNKVTAQDPNNRTAFFMKGFIYKETGDTLNAIQYFRRVTEMYPDYAPAFEELGVLYAVRKSPLAVEYLNSAMRLDPDNLNIVYNLAMYYQELDEPEMATDLYVKILEKDPQNKYAWHNRGYMSMILYHDYDAAIDFFTKAIEADNTYVDAHINRGLAYEMKGDKTNAAICYRTALQLDPNNEQASVALSRL